MNRKTRRAQAAADRRGKLPVAPEPRPWVATGETQLPRPKRTVTRPGKVKTTTQGD